jgi:hypothetical protein
MQSQRAEHQVMAASSGSRSKEEAMMADDAASANIAWASKRRRLATVYDAVAGT